MAPRKATEGEKGSEIISKSEFEEFKAAQGELTKQMANREKQLSELQEMMKVLLDRSAPQPTPEVPEDSRRTRRGGKEPMKYGAEERDEETKGLEPRPWTLTQVPSREPLESKDFGAGQGDLPGHQPTEEFQMATYPRGDSRRTRREGKEPMKYGAEERDEETEGLEPKSWTLTQVPNREPREGKTLGAGQEDLTGHHAQKGAQFQGHPSNDLEERINSEWNSMIAKFNWIDRTLKIPCEEEEEDPRQDPIIDWPPYRKRPPDDLEDKIDFKGGGPDASPTHRILNILNFATPRRECLECPRRGPGRKTARMRTICSHHLPQHSRRNDRTPTPPYQVPWEVLARDLRLRISPHTAPAGSSNRNPNKRARPSPSSSEHSSTEPRKVPQHAQPRATRTKAIRGPWPFRRKAIRKFTRRPSARPAKGPPHEGHPPKKAIRPRPIGRPYGQGPSEGHPIKNSPKSPKLSSNPKVNEGRQSTHQTQQTQSSQSSNHYNQDNQPSKQASNQSPQSRNQATTLNHSHQVVIS